MCKTLSNTIVYDNDEGFRLCEFGVLFLNAQYDNERDGSLIKHANCVKRNYSVCFLDYNTMIDMNFLLDFLYRSSFSIDSKRDKLQFSANIGVFSIRFCPFDGRSSEKLP